MDLEVLPSDYSFLPCHDQAKREADLPAVSGRRHRGAVTVTLPSCSISHSNALHSVSERDKLYTDFAPLVRRLIRQYGEDPAMREELHGEIYCRFCALLHQFDPKRGVPLRAYVVRQLSASIYIFARQHWIRSGREVYLDREIDGQCCRETVDPTASWDTALVHKQISTEIHCAIRFLSERQRRVIQWRYYEDRSFEEIGTLLNVQTSTARSLLRHAVNNLRKRIALQ